MTYYDENERVDLSFFYNDDSSSEDELVRVAEKLEAMQCEEEEDLTKKALLQTENNADTSYCSPIFNTRNYPESISFECASNSSPSIPTSTEPDMSRKIAAKHVAAIITTDNEICFEIRKKKTTEKKGDRKKSIFITGDVKKERRGPQQMEAQQQILCSRKENDEIADINTTIRGIISQNEACIRGNDFNKNVEVDQVVGGQESKHLQSFQQNEKERRPMCLPQNQQITAVKAIINESKSKNYKPKDARLLDDCKCNRYKKESNDDYNTAFVRKVDSIEHVIENEKQKEVFVDLTKMETTTYSSSYLDSSDYSSNRSEMTNYSDNCTSFSSSSTSLSDHTTEAAGATKKLPTTHKNSVDMRTQIHRSDPFPQFKHQLDSITKITSPATLDSTHMVNNCNSAPYSADGAKETIQLKMITNSSGTPSEDAPNSIDDSTTKRPSPIKLRRAAPVLRNPYIRERNTVITIATEAEPTMTHDFKNQHSFLKLSKPKRVTKFYNDDSNNDSKTQKLRPELSNKNTALTPTRKTKEMKHKEMIIVDRQGLGEGPEPEVPRSLYAPPVYREGQPSPTLHRFDCHNHPLHFRRSTLVGSLDRLFTSKIVNSLWAQKFDRFNHFQSAMIDTLSDSDNNLVVSAPTGAGKSTIFELAIARFLSADLRAQGQQSETPSSTSLPLVSKARKIVYISPSKALCEERYTDWSRRLKNMKLGLEVVLITGQDVGNEQASKSFPDLIAAHLIVTTPEKWDSMTRRWNESFFLFASVKLLLLDEVHLLGDESRGWCLESIVTRMKTIQRAASALITTPFEISTSSYTDTNPDAIRSCFRTVAVSATLPNISDVADFLQADEAYSFDDSYRPVPLTKHVNALGRVGNNEWKFWSNLSEHVPEIIKRFSHGKQSLIFCHSKKETQKVTELLIRRNFGNRGVRIIDPPWSEPVGYMLDHGVGYHHAGMSKDERKTIEEAFLNKKIKCLAATSTLAVGVNLPAHLVIIVGTKAWRNNEKGKGYQEIEVSALLQMVGRAGRPGLDSTGVAVILTDNCSKKRIENLLETGIGPAKSNLVPRLPEVLNTEISQRVIISMDEALQWLQTTFFFCCLKHNSNAVSFAQKLSNDTITYLREIGVVEISELDLIHPLAGSFIMNRRLVSFEQMKSITAFPFNASQCQILRSMSKHGNLQSFVKRNEKRELKEFHKSDLMKYKLPGVISKFIVKDPSEKAFILLQSHISRHKYKNEMLNDEQITVRDEAIKFLEVAQEYCVKASKHGKVALECYKLQRSLNYSLWGESSGVFNQFEWIGSSKTASNLLAFDGIRSFQDVLNTSEKQLDEIFAKIKILDLPKKAGRIVRNTAYDLCRHRLLLSTDIEYTKNSNKPTDLICSLKFHDPTVTMAREKREQDLKFSLIAYTDNSIDSSLIFEGNICSPSSFRVPLPSHSFQKLFVHLIGTWVGFDQVKIIDALNTLVSSNETSVRILQYPRAIRLETDAAARAKMKKRSLPTRSFDSTNQRHKKPNCTAYNEVKKPSPITPQTKEHSLGIPHSFMATNQQFSGGIWEESKEPCQSGQATTLSLSPGRSIPFNQREAEETSISINVTPTIHPPIKKALRQSPSSVNTREINQHGLPSKFANQKFFPFIMSHEKSTTSSLEKHCGQIGTDRYTLPTNKIYPFTIHESSDAMVVKEKEEIQKHAWDEPKRQNNRRTENGMIAYRATKTSGPYVEYSPLTNSRKGNQEKIAWNQSRTKQQRAQRRAFTEKKMNPFRTFSHDPNDIERHLEQLSQKSSIIPNPLLAKMKQSSIASNRKTQRHFSTDRNRRTRTVRHRYSNQNPQQVLREKAFEQQFQHEMTMSHQRNIPDCRPYQHPHEENQYVSKSLLPMSTWQSNVESFENPRGRTAYQLSYPKNDEMQSRFPHSPVSSGTLHFPVTEDGPRTYPTTIDIQYQPYIRTFGHTSSAAQFPIQPQTFEECDQRVRQDSYEISELSRDYQSQCRRFSSSRQSHREPSYSPADFESDF